jgi:hypothetical protein
LNALSVVGVLAVLFTWRRPEAVHNLPPEHFFGALKAGYRYTRHSPAMCLVLVRAVGFFLFGSALWAMLPLIARRGLGLDAAGYGALLGCMGADGQPQIQLQLYAAMIDFGLDIQEAIEMPRFLSGRFALGEARDTLHIESRFSESTIDALARRGHTINRWDAWNEMAGHAHGITIDRRNGLLSGVFATEGGFPSARKWW